VEKELKRISNFDPDLMPKWVATFWERQKYKNVVAGINDDDCAVIKVGSEEIIISVDYLNANPIALELGIGSFKQLGKLLVAANLSDLCGTGAKPIGFLTAIMLNKEAANKSEFIQFMKGVKKELIKHDVPLIGGDTKLGNSNCFCGVAIGKKEKGTTLFLKNGATPGDNIWVSGNLGSVAAAIDGLQKQIMSAAWNRWAIKRIISPSIPLNKSRKISKILDIHSGTDLSDGLGADLFALCNASKVGAIIEVDKIPIAHQVKEIAKKRKTDAWKYSLTIGGDFQFIVTAHRHMNLKKIGCTKIGRITKKKKLALKINRTYYPLPTKGHSDYGIVNFKQEIDSLLNNLKFGS
jgi:thiamine-monophosphate kinase